MNNNELLIELDIDKEPYIKRITDDKIINLTGESGSGKSYYTNKWKNDDNYIIIDTDIVFSNKESDNKESVELRSVFKDKTGKILIDDFDYFYKETINYFKDTDKILVIDSAQYRNMKDLSLLKGQIIVMRTSINTCYKRCIDRYLSINKNATEEELKKYKDRKLGMYEWYKLLNEFLIKIDK